MRDRHRMENRRGNTTQALKRHSKGSLILTVLEGTELLGREKGLTTPSTHAHTNPNAKGMREPVLIEALGANQRKKKSTQS